MKKNERLNEVKEKKVCYYLSVTMTTNTKNNDINMRKNEKVFPFLNDDEEFPLICACVRHDKVV
jgi:hypothetical protein